MFLLTQGSMVCGQEWAVVTIDNASEQATVTKFVWKSKYKIHNSGNT